MELYSAVSCACLMAYTQTCVMKHHDYVEEVLTSGQ